MNSPLGKYAAAAAAIVAVLLVGTYAVGTLLALPGAGDLKDLAIIATGAVLGSSVAVNGWKQPVAALHARLDLAGIPAAATPPAPVAPPPDPEPGGPVSATAVRLHGGRSR